MGGKYLIDLAPRTMKLHPTDAAAPGEQQQLAKYFLIQRSLTRRVKNITQHCKNFKSNPGGVHA